MTPEPDKDELQRRLDEERAQAAREARQGNGDPGDEHEDEPEAEDEPQADEPEAVTEPTPEQQAKRLGRVVGSFELELRELFGETEPLTPLSMDGAIGFMIPGMLEVKPNDKFRRCSTCNGHGQVLTGSLADGKQTADCPRCAGLGYLTRLEGDDVQPAAPTNGNNAVDPDAGFGVESWMGDPNIGAPS